MGAVLRYHIDGTVPEASQTGDRLTQDRRAFRGHCSLGGARSNPVQITSDGDRAYVEAVDGASGDDVDFAQLVKIYGPAPTPAGHYSPADCLSAKKSAVTVGSATTPSSPTTARASSAIVRA